MLAHQSVPYRLAAEHADLVFVTPRDAADLVAIRAELDAASDVLRGSSHERLRVFADLLVLIEDTSDAARQAAARLDDLAGAPLASDARIVVGTAREVIEEIEALAEAGVDGIRLRPARQPADVVAIAEQVVPLARAAGVLREEGGEATLRGRLELARPESRYVREKVVL